jgi:protein TonB
MERAVMVRAFASPPPVFSGGSPDLKGNARRFLERALVISALVHLAAAGLFRAADERDRARDSVDLKRINGVVGLIPRLFPPPIAPNWTPAPAVPPARGVFIPVDKILKPRIDVLQPGGPVMPEGPASLPGEGGKDGPVFTPGPPRDEPARPITIAEIPPVPVIAPLPAYPDFAREAGIEGRVIVRVLVGIDGMPKQVAAMSGPKMLFDAAVEGVRKWRFKPGMTSGQAVEVWVEIPVVFRLGS